MAQRRQVLIVEDNEVNREILKEILSPAYQVLEVENGQEALEILRLYKDRISVILLDVIMPVMDGFTFLNHLQEDPDMALIPVIVMTQSDNEESEVSALRHGAMDFVPKPYRPQIILHRMANLIKLRETAAVVNQFQYDHLTGLYSKEFFYEKVREQLDEHPEKAYTIICSDIENFKLYNNTFGREAGDRLLQETTAAMRRILGDNAICGRYGADCFLCLREREQERMDRERFFGRELLGAPQRVKSIVVKYGIYEITDRSIPIEKMCDRALLAAKSVKGQYNHPYAVYDDALREKLLREKQLTDAMETAIAEKQFAVYLQPKYDLQHNRLAGAEALVRWIHPEWGFLSPGEFIRCSRKMASSLGWTSTSGSRRALCCGSGRSRESICCPSRSTCPGRICI